MCAREPYGTWLRVCFVAAVFAAGTAAGGDPEPDGGPVAQMVCGTRVAEFTLTWYGKAVEPSDLVGELQGSRVDRLVSVPDLRSLFEKNDLFASIIRVTPPGTLDWGGPIVYHTLGMDGVGHFFVWVPARGQYPALYWCNVNGFSTELPPDYARGLSGVAVVVSDTPFTEDALSVAREAPASWSTGGWWLPSLGLVGVSTMVWCGWLLRRAIHARRETRAEYR